MSATPRVLAFDTSSAHCAAALLIDGRIVASRHEEMGKGQAERLFPMLDEILAADGATWSDLEAIGVGIGPGNFTGIRIAVSAARGLALALRIPAVGVSALEAQAHDMDGPVISSLPAPRGDIYAICLNAGSSPTPVLGRPETIALDIAARAEPTCVGAEADCLARRFAGHVANPKVPLVEAIAHIAALRKDSIGAAHPSPLYIRPADAAPASDPPPVILP